MPSIDGQRVVADLKRLAEFGRYKTGVHRPTYSAVDVESRLWLAERFREAGLDTVIDGIGNVIGRNRRAGRRLLVGSHSETQPYGGWLDGSLGVIYALELARAFAADPRCAELGLDVVAWADEEGHYGNFLGSRSFTGALPDEEIDRTRGPRQRDAAARGAGAGRFCRTAARTGRSIGVMSAISKRISSRATHSIRPVCASAWSRRSSGSGTTASHCWGSRTMPARRGWSAAATREWRWCGSRPAFTTGFPRSPALGRCGRSGGWCSSPMPHQWCPAVPRCRSSSAMPISTGWRRFEKALHELVGEADRAGPCACQIETIARTEPRPMDLGFQDQIEAAAERHAPGMHMRLPSAAGHDAAVLSYRMPLGDDVHSEPPRRQPSLVGGHQGGGHRARRPGLRGRRRENPALGWLTDDDHRFRNRCAGCFTRRSTRRWRSAPIARGAGGRFRQRARAVPGAGRAVRRHGRCRLGRSDAGHADL